MSNNRSSNRTRRAAGNQSSASVSTIPPNTAQPSTTSALTPGTLSANTLFPAKLDTIQAVTLTISVFALVAALWAANETRQTRLDARRTLLRNEAYAMLIELRSSLNTFNCYALVKGVEIKEKDSFMKFMDEQESSIREGMIEMWDYPADGLTAYEKSLNTNKTQARSTFHQTITMIRNSWDKDLREKADSICSSDTHPLI